MPNGVAVGMNRGSIVGVAVGAGMTTMTGVGRIFEINGGRRIWMRSTETTSIMIAMMIAIKKGAILDFGCLCSGKLRFANSISPQIIT